MKPEFEIEGREASPAEYAQLRQSLLASQATTPTARACADGEAIATAGSILDSLLGAEDIATTLAGGRRAARAKGGERAVYPRVSTFVEGRDPTSTPSEPPAKAAPGRYE